MWYDGAPFQGQCEGCTFNVWHLKDATVYLDARGVSSAVLTSGAGTRWRPTSSSWGTVCRGSRHGEWKRGSSPKRGTSSRYLRDGERVFMTYSTTGRGNEPADSTLGLLDMTPYGRREGWEDNP